ncbi:hypothetical protein BpHYR1_048036 [Brachionus plicatilis]|uniref:Uncharacterized protein n=1 Tax=Brachionus plicatilis TaxID=10195 RepID=A0A3M7TAW1_BRAPC|nr:hypothetical protein BpHYR1_048036 [Brachionus plicatilis]
MKNETDYFNSLSDSRSLSITSIQKSQFFVFQLNESIKEIEWNFFIKKSRALARYRKQINIL